MKKLIMVTMVAACLALCAAVWLQATPAERVAATPPPPAVTATQPDIPELPAVEEFIMPEEEKAEIPQPELIHEVITTPELVPEKAPVAPETQPTLRPEPNPEPVPAPVPAQVATDPQPGDMVYVPGFGWLECQGPGEVIYAEDMYENGNKIGSMG